jgi:AcrR family transcriptional regulator
MTRRTVERLSDRTGGGASDASPGKLSTKDRLIDTGEFLIAFRGVDGVSLREIASAAGQSNNYAVQYHVKDKTGLVRAILKDKAVYRVCHERGDDSAVLCRRWE